MNNEIRIFLFFLQSEYFFVLLQTKDYNRHDKLRPKENLHHHL